MTFIEAMEMRIQPVVMVAIIIMFAVFLVKFIMPSKLKRIMFVTTIYLYLEKMGVLNAKSLSEINAMMHLARSDDALLLPHSVFERIWSEDKLSWIHEQKWSQAIATDSEGKDRNIDWINQCIESTPHWLRYDRQRMVSDILNIFQPPLLKL